MSETVFSGTRRFRIKRKIGQGGMGAVYEAFDTERGEVVALKTLLELDPNTLLSFKREFRALADVVHPNLVSLYELVSEAGQWFFTMEHIHGVDFLAYVRGVAPKENPNEPSTTGPPAPHSTTVSSHESTPNLSATAAVASDDPTGPLGASPPEASQGAGSAAAHAAPPAKIELLRPALRQLTEALVALHESGHVHCDIKPSNVMITPEGRVVLLDFGIVAELGKKSVPGASKSEVLGTPLYMAPELARDPVPAPANDWYAMGVVLYQALSGRRPSYGTSTDIFLAKQRLAPVAPKELRPGVPDDLNDLCLALLNPDPEQRPGGQEILRRLGATGEAQLPSEPSTDSTAIVGRQAQFKALMEAFEGMRKGKGSTVLVRGPSGLGKSSLVQYFLSTLPRDVELLAGRCYEREAVPFKAIDDVVDTLCALLLRWPAEKVRALVPSDAAALAQVFPVLRRVESIAAMAHEQIVLTEQLKRRAFDALAELLGNVASQAPLVLFVDDLQWGDTESAPFFLRLMGEPTPPILLLGTYRSEEVDTSRFLQALLAPDQQAAGFQKSLCLVDVVPLSIDDATGLARSLLERFDAPASLAERIAKESEGNPYFVQEFVRVTRAIGLEATKDLRLDGMILARTVALTDGARRLLEGVAVAGWRVPQIVLQRAAELSAEHHRALAELRNGHFVRTSGTGEYACVEAYHDRVRAAVLTSLGADTEKRWHGRLAVALDGWMGPHKPEFTYPLATHYYLAGDPLLDTRAYDVSWAAGRMSASSFAVDQALRFIEQAKEIASRAGIAPTPDFDQFFGETCAQAGRMDQAMVHLEHALERSTDVLQRGRLRLGISKVHLGRLDTAASRAEVARALAELGLRGMKVRLQDIFHSLWQWAKGYLVARNPARFGSSSNAERQRHRLVANAYQHAGLTAYFDMDPVAMALNIVCGYESAALLGNSPELAETYSGLGALAGAKRKKGLARRLTQRSVEVGEKLNNPAVRARAQLFGAYAYHFIGAVTEAAERMRASLERYGRFLENVDYLTGCADLSWNLLMRGYPSEGWKSVQNALQRAALGGQSRLSQGHTYICYAGPLLTMLGEHERGIAHLDEFHAVIADTPQDRWRWGQYLAHRALALVLQGRIDAELEGVFARHQQLSLAPGKVPLQLRQYYVAQAYARLWQYERATTAQRPLIKQAFEAAHLDLKRSGMHETLRAHWHVIGAGFERVAGKISEATASLAEAENLARQFDNPWVLAEVAEERARHAQLRSDLGAARSFAASALQFATERGWAARGARIRAEFKLS